MFCAVMAGGIGSRMNGAVPKQFIELGGIPVLVHTLRHFTEYGGFDGIAVASPAEHMEQTERIIAGYFPHKGITVVQGGKNRNCSLLNVCRYIRSAFGAGAGDIIVTHDAVRPFINSRIIEQGIRAARSCGAANTVMPAVDTIVRSTDGVTAHSVPDRNELFRVQTPQTFDFAALFDVIDAASDEDMERYTDACGLYMTAGRQVALVRGGEQNIKLTTPFDLITAQAFLDGEKADKTQQQ